LRLSSFGGYGLALAALALVVFGADDSYPISRRLQTSIHESLTSIQEKYDSKLIVKLSNCQNYLVSKALNLRLNKQQNIRTFLLTLLLISADRKSGNISGIVGN